MDLKISVIIPVFNEPYIINNTIEHLNCLFSTKKSEIIVVDGHPSINTINALNQRHVKRIFSPRGRGIQMNLGAKEASGEIFLFLHADTFLPENAPNLIKAAIDDQQAVAGAFDLGIRSPKLIFRLIEKMVYIRSRITRIPYGDQGIFIKKSFFEKIGGFHPLPLMEDVNLMRRVKKAGGKIAFIHNKVSTSPRRWEKEGIISCTLRNWILILLYLTGVPAEKLSKFYP